MKSWFDKPIFLFYNILYKLFLEEIMKKVLVLCSSPRVDGNTELLAKKFVKGVESVNGLAQVEYIRLADKHIGFCQGCRACAETEQCYQKDDMQVLIDKVLDADVLVFATPVYFYTMSAQMKVFIDRLTPIYEKVRADIYILATAWDDEIENLQLTAESIRGLTQMCFENCEEKGCLLIGGCEGKGDVVYKPKFADAFEMGKNI